MLRVFFREKVINEYERMAPNVVENYYFLPKRKQNKLCYSAYDASSFYTKDCLEYSSVGLIIIDMYIFVQLKLSKCV